MLELVSNLCQTGLQLGNTGTISKALQFSLSLSLGRVLQSYVLCKCPPHCCAQLGTISKALQFSWSLSLGRVLLLQSYVLCKCPPQCCAKLRTISKAVQSSLSLSLGRVLLQSYAVPVSVLPTPGSKPDSLLTAWV